MTKCYIACKLCKSENTYLTQTIMVSDKVKDIKVLVCCKNCNQDRIIFEELYMEPED